MKTHDSGHIRHFIIMFKTAELIIHLIIDVVIFINANLE